jgi:uncharacterized membrane protein
MTPLIIAMAAFIGTHLLLSSGPVRRPLVRAIGEGPFSGAYSVVALALIVWTVIAFERTPVEPLWALPWTPIVPALAMPLALLFLVCGLSQRNPTMVGAQFSATDAAADPAPGILRVTRHPVLWAFALWALAHIVPNGDVASLIFFGGFALLALAGTVIIDVKRRGRDPDGYARFAAATSRVPFLALLLRRTRPDWRGIGWWRLGVTVLLYAALFAGHSYYTGVPVLPLQ